MNDMSKINMDDSSSPPKIGGAGGGMTEQYNPGNERHPNNTLRLKFIRRDLRNNSTKAEKSLWNWLKGRNVEGLKFRRQFSVDNHILDFYCPVLRLCIELDGDYHYHVNQPLYDAERDKYLLEKYGIHTLRFENNIVFNQPHTIINAIINFKEQFSPTPQIATQKVESGTNHSTKLKDNGA